ncbi:MAG: hypothetical protein IPM91_09625 [Bacteroidetes bacterium]|nr:hypothetical protein [Bacteroidota bacterium]
MIPVLCCKNFQWNNFPAFDGLMGVRHGNGRIGGWFSKIYNKLIPLILLFISGKCSGISGPLFKILALCEKREEVNYFNSNGSQFAQVSWLGMIELYNFDRCTGTITSTIR